VDVRRGVAGLIPRTQSAAAVSPDGRIWALLNASPEITLQLQRNAALHPHDPSRVGGRHSPVHTVLITNGDVDHMSGLIGLREMQAFRVLATAEILSLIEQNPIFGVLNRSVVTFEAIRLEESFELVPGVKATVFAVPGKVPLYLEGETVITDLVGEQTVGVEIEGSQGERLYYIPGCARLTPALKARITGAEAVMFDGTLYDDDEMIRQGVGVKTGARMGHMAMGGSDGTVQAFKDVAVKRRVFVHINNTNPALREGSPERRTVEAAGWEIGYDGMELQL
jgi:pyrroloquinoline quinone biosynthesis protein B